MKHSLPIRLATAAIALLSSLSMLTFAQTKYASDQFTTASGKIIKITFIKHASIVIDCDGYKIYVDPVTNLGTPTDFSKMAKADAILITHEHIDHYDPAAIRSLTQTGTKLVANPNVTKKLHRGTALANGQSATLGSAIKVEAVPAYNTTAAHKAFHPQGRDNGYILTFDATKIYIAGDTEDIPEMSTLKDIDIAFLPVNQPYTMTPEQCVKAALAFMPKVLYPYHFNDTPIKKVSEGLRGKNIDVRIRDLQ